jgi:Response regulator containing a CheY-like receiver domain and an HTH DNA-binding domain
MSMMPLLVIGHDPGWRARMERILGMRAELEWIGAYAPSQQRPGHRGIAEILLLDGDDATVERSPRRPLLPAPRRLYFYRQPDVTALLHCIASKAHACLDKQAPPAAVMRAILAVESGMFVTLPSLLQQALDGVSELPGPTLAQGEWATLTGRQREIVHWAARGMSNKQIARQLGISPETVKTHLHHVFEREGVHNRVALLALHHDAETPQGDG